MKILWVNSVFLHPTTRGGQIRTLEMLRRLHQRHEVHYAALADPDQPEGVQRSPEYCTRAHPISYKIADKRSPQFFAQLIKGWVSPVPVVVFRKQSAEMKRAVGDLLAKEHFDSVVCDFLTPSINMPRLEDCVLFQHNVETMIWRRYAENASNPIRRMYMRRQAARMFDYERRVCRSVRHVIAVSDVDADLMRRMFGISNATAVPTGVDLEFFARPEKAEPVADLVFIGSMDYMPNVDGVLYFVKEILPLVRRSRPDCTFTVVGRKPPREILALAGQNPHIRVTGTVPDVRPFLWGSPVSIVPLRIGGGTRLKIYESMAAGTAVVSTTIGAEGLLIHPPHDIRIGDTPEAFAAECVRLLENVAERTAVAEAGLHMVTSNFSWEQVCRDFEGILAAAAYAKGHSSLPGISK
ncbi:MAG: glycosyltransferase family 4 protein [Bryobacteraceae bacterium]